MKELVESIVAKHQNAGIDVYAPATCSDIKTFEQQIGFSLPAEFNELYSICNGFGCNEDIFNIVPIQEINLYASDYGNGFYFAEYMIYSDMWGLRLSSSGNYEIFNGSYPDLTLTSSLHKFLSRFLQGNVFDPNGLYEWLEEIRIK